MQQVSHSLRPFITILVLFFVLLSPLVSCLSHGGITASRTHNNIKQNANKLSSQMISYFSVHGLLLWASMGFLIPVGILTIRMADKEEAGRRLKFLLYLHAIFQILAVLLATVGAVMSIRNFENSFNNHHQRLGLALYVAISMQAIIGFFRPRRGSRRTAWYLTHWIVGTIISVMGIINIYTGLKAYHKKTSKSTAIWTILFTLEISFIASFYLFQDKWEYIQKQGLVLGNNSNCSPQNPTPPSNRDQENAVSQRDIPKVVLPQPCAKRNALGNLFD
ncbi:Cytochrome b561 domain-containing protein [Hibiscus syriacus]|uniref:Cytochrome b561 domain-containing protein n=1 Tax=Hibiscus syriacus TaxID=106335 RepID=A0A6A2ZWT3_HIBSY|nr:cytochrome b561 domain-containing protein At4g18260-like [Hibiscus syriacus]KAE8696454.1 Cytochrome b561 domain-containing protein [Hibiscus syriacus]